MEMEDTAVPAEEALAVEVADKVCTDCTDCKECMGYNSFYSSCCGCSDSLDYTT